MKIKTGIKCPCCGEWAIAIYDTDKADLDDMISGKSRLPADIIAHKQASEKDLEAEAYFEDNNSKVKNFSLAVVGFQLIIAFLNFLIWQVFVEPVTVSTGKFPDTDILQLSLYAVVISFGVNLLATGITLVSAYFHKKKYKYEQLSENESLLERVSIILVGVNSVVFSIAYMALVIYIANIMENIAVFVENAPLMPF